eukprot:11166705-Lingulodinium_polyedra.AAC.1
MANTDHGPTEQIPGNTNAKRQNKYGTLQPNCLGDKHQTTNLPINEPINYTGGLCKTGWLSTNQSTNQLTNRSINQPMADRSGTNQLSSNCIANARPEISQ